MKTKKLKTGIYTTIKNGRVEVYTTKPLTKWQRFVKSLSRNASA